MHIPIDDLPLLLVATILLVWGSRKSLRQPGSHGYYRFFAAEIMLVLMIFNRQLVGDQSIANILLGTSAVLAIFGFLTLRMLGRAAQARGDETLLGFEKTTTLVTGGIFRFIRHPMYAALIALTWGFFFRDPSWIAGLLAVPASFLYYLTARADERECLAYFGEPYADYMRRTRRFIPYLI